MDTKWKRSEKIKGFTGIAAFVVGLSLTLWSLCAAGQMLRTADPEMEWWRTGWQETTAFKTEVSRYLRDFLSMGSGTELDWYDMENREKKESVFEGLDWRLHGFAATAASETPIAATVKDLSDLSADAAYQKDDNLIYRVADDMGRRYANVKLGELGSHGTDDLPEGYNFYLAFKGGKVYIYQNGEQIDIYGDSIYDIYDSTEQWYLPGYANFPVGDGVSTVRVYLAVRETPVKVYTGGYYSYSPMYDLYEEFHACRTQALYLLYLLAAGIALLVVSFSLRRYRAAAEAGLAKLTRHIWTEFRFTAVAGSAVYHLFAIGFLWYGDRIFMAFFEQDFLTALAAAVFWFLTPNSALLCLFWALWLIRLDHRYNPKEMRRSFLRLFFGALRARDLKRPIQKRLACSSVGGLLAMWALLMLSVPVLVFLLNRFSWSASVWYIAAAAAGLLADLLLLLLMFSTWKSMRTAKDIGLLADRITAIHNGDLTTYLALPKDADLCRAAEELGDIQSGMEKALAERTQSERMKVELISNVSHDLKTPLTSVLSYAQLLEEEHLDGPAGDYARIILEKAQRLNTMVQDVFAISKAASGQLPMKIERIGLSKLLRQTLADMDDAIAQSGLTIKTELPEGEVEIVADGERLCRVFQNLLQNALQYSLSGSRVYLTLTAESGAATAMVRNTSAQELPEGVDFTARFVRGDESRTDGGSGLGLSIAASFTEACGGVFTVETLADLFTAKVTFPLAAEQSKAF